VDIVILIDRSSNLNLVFQGVDRLPQLAKCRRHKDLMLFLTAVHKGLNFAQVISWLQNSIELGLSVIGFYLLALIATAH
jgi:hypothetical protein